MLALALYRTPVAAAAWVGVALSVAGLLLLNGVPGGSALGNALVLGNAVAQSFQIVAMERFAPRYDPRALTFLQMAVSCAAFTAIALGRGSSQLPHGGTVWFALVVTGVFAGALGYLVATWVQSRTTAARAALVFTLEAPFAALFGVVLLSERLGVAGWAGCGVMLAGILLAEPAAAATLRRLVAAARARLTTCLTESDTIWLRFTQSQTQDLWLKTHQEQEGRRTWQRQSESISARRTAAWPCSRAASRP